MELIVFILIIALDQVSKIWVNRGLSLGETLPLWKGVFHITNVHNDGAAWGMLSGGRIIFLIFTPLFCGALIWFLIKKRSRLSLFGRLCVTLLIAGAVGNFIDRVAYSYVRDMFDFCLIHFPVFNVADSAITVGAIMLVADTLFNRNNSILDTLDKKKDSSDPLKNPCDTQDSAAAAFADKVASDTPAENGESSSSCDSLKNEQTEAANHVSSNGSDGASSGDNCL